MSWDATLRVPGVDWAARDWNYTHNTNPMINAALGIGPGEDSWWRLLDGMNGAEGCGLLSNVIAEFDRNPDRYRSMNPPNGWGDFDRLRRVLQEMIDACAVEVPLVWEVSG